MSEAKERLDRNRKILITAEAEGHYPRLFECLNKYGDKGLMKRLEYLYGYTLDVLEGRSDMSGVWCKRHKQFEVMAALDVLVSTYKGSKATWSKAVQQLAFMGLIQPHKPTDSIDYNEPKQVISAERARDIGNKHPVTWYGIPAYTDEVLMAAEQKAPFARRVTDKDSIRDKVGSAEANRIHDSSYGQHPETTERRQLLRETLAALVALNGYAYVEAVKTAVRNEYDRQHNNNPVGSEAWERQRKRHTSRVTQTWDGYRDTLLNELGMVYRKPTEQERQFYGLVTYKYFICPR